MRIPAPSKRNKGNTVKLVFICTMGGLALFLAGKQRSKVDRLVRSDPKSAAATVVSSQTSPAVESAPATGKEDWRGAPIGDGEDTIDSYHSYDHRPPGSDPRDILLQQYPIHPCPNNGVGSMVSGQDPRYFEIEAPANRDFKERNPKFICDVAKLPLDEHKPCVIYSFGSWDEISFEVRWRSFYKPNFD